MTTHTDRREAPLHTIGELGLSPPFFQWRVDLIGWLAARHYHRWLWLATSAIVLAEAARLGLAAKNVVASINSFGIAIGFITLYLFYNLGRRWMFFNHVERYFDYRFQLMRAAGAILTVAALQYLFDTLVPGTLSLIWMLYVPALLIASEHQTPHWAGAFWTVGFFWLVAGLQWLMPALAGQVRLDLVGLVTIAPALLGTWVFNLGFHYLLRNAQKRSLFLKENQHFARRLVETRVHANNLELFWKTCLRITLERLRAGHGSIWVCSPASGRMQLVHGLHLDGTRPNSAARDWTATADHAETAYRGVARPNLVQHVAATGQPAKWSVSAGYVAAYLDGDGPSPFTGADHPPLVYQLAAPVKDRGSTGNVIGVVNINYTPGRFEWLADRWPVLRGLRTLMHRFLLKWEIDMLAYTAMQLSPAWEHTRLVHTFEDLANGLPGLYADLNHPGVADQVAALLTHVTGTTVFVWCLRNETVGYRLNGLAGAVPDAVKVLEAAPTELGALTTGVRFATCPAVLATLVPFDEPQLQLFPVGLGRNHVGAVGLAVWRQDSLTEEEERLIQGFLDQVAYAVANTRLLNDRDRRIQTLQAIQALTQDALKPADLETFCDETRRLIEDKLGVPRVHLGVERGAGEIEFATNEHEQHTVIPLTHGPEIPASAIETALRTGRTIVLDRIRSGEQPLGPNWPKVTSAAIFPLPGEDNTPRGVLVVHDDGSGFRMSAEVVASIGMVATVLGLILHRILHTLQLKRIAGLIDAPYLIPMTLFAPQHTLSLALAELANVLHAHVFPEATFVAIWEKSQISGELELSAIHPRDLKEAIRRHVPNDSDLLKTALASGPYCRKAPGNSRQGETSWECAAPIGERPLPLGVLVVGSATLPANHTIDRPAIGDVARMIAESWFRRNSLEQTARDAELAKIRTLTHAHALHAARLSLRSWHKFNGLYRECRDPEERLRLDILAAEIGSELEGLETLIDIHVRMGRYAVLHDDSLTGAVQDSLRAKRIFYQGECELVSDLDETLNDYLSSEEAEALFTIHESAVSNALKAPGVTRICVSLAAGPRGELSMTITDNGEGFDPALVESDPSHFGVRSMIELAEKIGWRFEVKMRPEDEPSVLVYSPSERVPLAEVS